MTHDNSGEHVREPAGEPRGASRVDAASHGETVHTPPRYGAVAVSAGGRRHDLVSWGAVWAGLVLTLTIFLLLEFIFFALGWLTFAQGAPDSTAGLVTGVLALIAFFIGGMVAGSTSVWRTGTGGLLHGLLLWALGIVAMLFLTLFGGGALFGTVASVLAQATSIQQAVNVPDVQVQEAISTARDAAAWAALGLVLPLVAAALGGVIGGKIGPRRDDGDVETSHDRPA